MATDQAKIERRGADLREYLAILRHRKWTILVITALVTGSALGFSFRQTPRYVSEAKVLVKPFNTPLNLETERELAGSEAVQEFAAEHLETGLTGDALSPGNLEVSVAAQTEVLIFGYSHTVAGEAQRAAQAYAEGYLDYRRRQIIDDITTSAEAIRERIEPLNIELERLNSRILEEQDPGVKSTLQVQANSLISRIAVLEQQIVELSPPGRLQVGQVVEEADLPVQPSSPNHLANGGLGFIIGLWLGIAAAFLRERLGDRLRGRTDLEQSAATPVLAVVPSVSWRRSKRPMLVTLEQPKSPGSEAYRTLRTGVLFMASQQNLKTILITSAQPGEGKTATTANLGVALAQAGSRVISISGDLRKPRLAAFFSGDRGRGLSDVLRGESDLWRTLQNTDLPNLKILPAGPIPPNPTELLGSTLMKTILESTAAAADVVLIDSPPVLALADAITLARMADGVLFVADAQRTRRSAIEHARSEIDRVGGRVIGAVLNNFDPSKGGAQSYYAQDYYTYEAKTRLTSGRETPRDL